jgi:acyl dehydratase
MGTDSKIVLNKELPKLVKQPITRVQLAQYAGASGDFNRIHIDEEFAKSSPLNGVIAHGMLSMGFLGQYLDQIAGHQYEVKKFKVRFRAMVRPGDTITCEAEVKEESNNQVFLELQALNQHNEAVILGEGVLLSRK